MAGNEAAIIDHLGANAGITALVSDRISPDIRRQGDALPAIVYVVQDDDRSHGTLNAAPTLVRITMQIDCVAETHIEARDLAAAVVAAIGDRSFTGVQWCSAHQLTTNTQRPDDGTGDAARIRTVQVSAWIEE